MGWEPTSIRLGVGWAVNPIWCDTDQIEAKHESPPPTRLDAVQLKIAGETLIDWERPEFRFGRADDVQESGSGRRRRGPNMRLRDVVSSIIDDTPDNSAAFFAVRPRGGPPARLNRFQQTGGDPPTLDVYEIGRLSNAVYRQWKIVGGLVDSYDDLDRDPFPKRMLKQELIVIEFTELNIIEVSSEETKRVGKRPVPRSAE